MEEYKRTERRRYDAAALTRGGAEVGDDLTAHGPELIAPEFRRPYERFQQLVRDRQPPPRRILDIGAGTGVHSLAGAPTGAALIGTDIAIAPLGLARRRAAANDVSMAVVTADAEHLPFRDGAIDVVTSAGALYCLDFERILGEVTRVLSARGSWIIVDSLDANPVYRMNRAIGHLRGRRTRLALTNIPKRHTIRRLQERFDRVEVAYFGAATFLAPLLGVVLPRPRVARLLDAFDDLIGPPASLAFKFVALAEGPRPARRA